MQNNYPRVAFYYTLNFQKRVLIRIANYLKNVLITDELSEIKNWGPDFILTADYTCRILTEHFKNTNIKILAVRHGAVNKYSEPEDDFKYADYIFGSEYEKKYLESGNVKPRIDFKVTGNAWVDETFKIPFKEINQNSPKILFAPTYNPEISAANVPSNKLYDSIKKVFNNFNLIIKPHPALINCNFEHIIKNKNIFNEWMSYWQKLSDNNDNVKLITDDSIPISEFFFDTDILISDRSSLIWEFLILEKPIILFYTDQKPEYWSNCITNLSIDNMLDIGLTYNSTDKFIEALEKVFDYHQSIYKTRQRKYKDIIYGNYQDGLSAKRIAEEINNIFQRRIEDVLIKPKYIYESYSYYGNNFTNESKNNIRHDNSFNKLQLAELLIEKNELYEAAEILSNIIKENPNYIDALNDFAVVQILLKNFFEAEKLFEQIFTISPNNEVAIGNYKYLIENSRKLLKNAPLNISKISSFDDFINYQSGIENEYISRREFENKLIQFNSDEFYYRAYCIVCQDVMPLQVDFNNAYQCNGRLIPNWRESLICPGCGLNNRLRLTYHIINILLSDFFNASVYITEQMTSFYNILKKINPKIVGSEFLGKEVPLGSVNDSGIRNEDFTNLTFHDEQFDYIISLEVLEHIHDYKKALKESFRTLKSNGKFLFTVPFNKNSKKNIIRAKFNKDGTITHILPPEYHDNPLSRNENCLCYYHFGWELLDDLKNVGFKEAYTIFIYSKEYGYLGEEQIFFIATKG